MTINIPEQIDFRLTRQRPENNYLKIENTRGNQETIYEQNENISKEVEITKQKL